MITIYTRIGSKKPVLIPKTSIYMIDIVNEERHVNDTSLPNNIRVVEETWYYECIVRLLHSGESFRGFIRKDSL